LEAISRKVSVENARANAIKKIKDNKETIDKMNQGKFTFKGLFKNQGEKAMQI